MCAQTAPIRYALPNFIFTARDESGVSVRSFYLGRVSRALRGATAAPLCCSAQGGKMAGILLKIVAPRQLVRGAGVPCADVGDEILLVESEAVLLAVKHPLLDRQGVIRIISVLGAVPGALRAAAPAALIWITVERGLAPLLLNSVVGATSPGVAARVAASPRHHAAAAAVSDARRVVLRSHGAQFTFLVPIGRVDACTGPGAADMGLPLPLVLRRLRAP